MINKYKRTIDFKLLNRFSTCAFFGALCLFMGIGVCVLEAAEISLVETSVSSDVATIQIPVSFNTGSSESVSSLECTLVYDDTVLSFSDAQVTDTLVAAQKLIVANESSPGKIKFLIYGLNDTAIADGIITYLNFTIQNGLNDSQIDVRLSDVIASAPQAQMVQAVFVNNPIYIGLVHPSVAITFPGDNQTLGRLSTIVRASVDAADVSEIIFGVEGDGSYVEYQSAVINGSAECSVDIADGTNTIIAYAYNSSSQMGMDTIRISVNTDMVGTPQFLNEDNQINSGDFRIEWTDESASGAVSYELKRMGGSVRPGDLSDDLISYWPFDEPNGDAYDAAGTNDLRSINSVGSGTGLFDESARLFQKANKRYFQIDEAHQDEFNFGEKFSIGFWLYLTSANTAYTGIIDKDYAGGRSWAISLLAGRVNLFVARNNSSSYYISSNTVLSQGQWYHVALTWNKDESAKIYINGECESVWETPGFLPQSTSTPVRIGASGYSGNPSYFFDGRLKDVAVWSRSLEGSEISNLYYSGLQEEWVAAETFSTANTYFDETEREERTYSYQVRALDTLGEASEFSDTFEITIDMTAPVAPTMNALPELSNQTTYVLTGTKSNDSVSVEVSAPDMTVESIQYLTDTQWQADVVFTRDGAYDVSARAVDAAGNRSSVVTVPTHIDTSAPYITSINDTANGVAQCAGTQITVTAVGEPDCGGYFRVDDVTSFITMNEISAGNYRGTYTLENGDDASAAHVVVRLVDRAGNDIEQTHDTPFRIDTIPPTIIAVSENTAGSVVKTGDEIIVEIEGEPGQSARFTIEGVSANNSMVEIASGRYQGVYTVAQGDDISAARVSGVLIDAVGNSRSMDATSTVSIDTVAPIITITSHADNDAVTAREVTIEGTVDDGTVDTISINGDPYAVSNRLFSANVSFDSEGINTILLSAEDMAGNIATQSFVMRLVFPPEVPVIVAPENQAQKSDFRLEWTDESASGAVGYELKRMGGSVRPGDLSDDLISYWPFDEPNGDAYDAAGTNDLRSINSVGSGTGLFDESARLFQKANKRYFQIDEAHQDEFNFGEKFSIGFWLYLTSANTAYTGIIDKDYAGGRSWAISLLAGRVNLFVARNNSSSYYISSNTVLSQGQWYHVALTWNKDESAKIYINGECESVWETPGFLPQSTSTPVRIGASGYSGSPSYFFDGRLKDVAVWSRSLEGSEISDLYYSGLQDEWVAAETITTVAPHSDESFTTDRTYTYQVRAFTADDIFSDWSAEYSITVDATPPNAPSIDALPSISNQTSRVVGGTKTSDTAGISISAQNMTVNSISYPSETTWEADVTFTQDGSYDIGVVASDAAGNDSTSVWASTVVDTTPPVVTIATPVHGFTTPQKAISIEGSVNEVEIPTAALTISHSSGNTTQTIALSGGGFSFDYALSKGLNTFTFTATDAAGNIGSASVQVSFSNNLPLVFVPIGNKAIGYGETLEFHVSVLNQAQIHPELLSIRASGLPGSGTDNPATYDPSTGIFRWTPTEDQVGLHQDISFIAEDDNKFTIDTIKIIVQSYDVEASDFQSIIGNANSSQVVIDDFNGDGAMDLYLVNVGENILFMNNQDGTFIDMTAVAGVGDAGSGVSALSIDVNNDGRKDLYVVNESTNLFYLNNGDGTFTERTASAGLGNSALGIAAYAKDFNGDTFMDVFLLNEDTVELFINNGNGTYSNATDASGLSDSNGAVSACLADIDSDGSCDIYIVAASGNRLFLNDGHGVFTDITNTAGIGEFISDCKTRIYDIDYDGDADIVIKNHSCDVYYLNNGDEVFTRATFLKTSDDRLDDKISLFFDYDADGNTDVLIVDTNSKYVGGLGNILYANNGDGTFADVTIQANLL